MQATAALERLLSYALAKGLLEAADIHHARGALLYAMRMDAPEAHAPEDASPLPQTATPMLDGLCGIAVSRGFLEDTQEALEQFAAHLMNLLTPPPSRIQERFLRLSAASGASAATDWLYALCRAGDYIRVDQIARNIVFAAPSPYGELTITINLSKPEKDPRDIARLKDAPDVGYPRCMLCLENEGYAGRPGYATHETLRTVPIRLGGEAWRLQFSPYSYYTEHCIALNERHVPMSISRRTFALLFDFVDLFPHYFIGSNADLPIVGGSILNHDHFQGGRHVFPMDRARPHAAFAHPAHPDITLEAVRWPMTCLRLTSPDRASLTDLAEKLLLAWRAYDDPSRDVLHESLDQPHNTLTPIARRLEDGRYRLQLVLRNNRTTNEHPLGIFHPHADLHHIKRENIGLIEVMGLFVLPGRLSDELSGLTPFLTGERPLERPDGDDPLCKHYAWLEALARRHGTSLPREAADRVLRDALTAKCVRVLEDSGVFKPTPDGDEGLFRFLQSVGIQRA